MIVGITAAVKINGAQAQTVLVGQLINYSKVIRETFKTHTFGSLMSTEMKILVFKRQTKKYYLSKMSKDSLLLRPTTYHQVTKNLHKCLKTCFKK